MEIISTAKSLEIRSQPESMSRTRGRNCEEDFLDWATVASSIIKTSCIYIPIQWYQCAIQDAIKKHVKSFGGVAQIQSVLDRLPSPASYFTVSRSDDDIYQQLPASTIVFGAGAGDIPIPLLPMNIVNVPAQLQTPRLRLSPDRAYGWSIEEHALRWFSERADCVKKDWAYLPVLWWNNTAARQLRGRGPFFAVKEVQEFLNSLPPDRRYFTISRGADGIYESLPFDLLVFSAGGKGDVAIPHLAELDSNQRQTRDLLASFVGNINSGGPVIPAPQGASSWNPDGAGSIVRRAMHKVFADEEDCLISNQQMKIWEGAGLKRHQEFCETATRSWFGLAPRGYGRTSYRLYEMLHLGTVPVYIYDDPWLPYRDVLNWDKFAVLCHVSELVDLPARLRGISVGKRCAMIRRGRELIPDYFTPDGVCKQIVRYLEAL